MKITRHATANWQGTGREGQGTISTQSKTLDRVPLSFKTRVGDGTAANPEELIGAAHAGCFSMKLAFILEELGYKDIMLDTTANVVFENGKITNVHLDLNATIPSITDDVFQKAARNAKEECPVSMLLNAEITLNAVLN